MFPRRMGKNKSNHNDREKEKEENDLSQHIWFIHFTVACYCINRLTWQQL